MALIATPQMMSSSSPPALLTDLRPALIDADTDSKRITQMEKVLKAVVVTMEDLVDAVVVDAACHTLVNVLMQRRTCDQR